METLTTPIKQKSAHMVELQPTFRRTCLPVTDISDTTDTVDLLRKLWTNEMDLREEVYLLLLDTELKVFGWANLFKGSVHGCPIDPAVIMQLVLIYNASFFVVAHNHPSGNLLASPEDQAVANKLYRMGEDHGRGMLEFLILTSEGFNRVLYSEEKITL